MTTRRERERTIAELSKAGIDYHVITKLLRYGTTLHRLAEAQCNGDWPCDNGERKVKPCSRCQGLWVPSSLKRKGLCPDCRTEDLIRDTCTQVGLVPDINGDPRGAVLCVKLPGQGEHDRGIFVA